MCDTRPTSIGLDLSNQSRRSSPSVTIASPAINIDSKKNQIDGFSSPRDSAHTPPGVVTKLETRMYKTPTTGSPHRCVCICCLKEKKDSFCKHCTAGNLAFYSRKETLFRAQQKKSQLSDEIEAIAKGPCSLAYESNATSENIEHLKRQIAEKKRRIEDLSKENNKIARTILNVVDVKKKLEPYLIQLKNSEKYGRVKENDRRTKLAEKQKDLCNLRREFALILSGIFPVLEVFAETEPSQPSTHWALVNGTEPIIGQIFKIRDMACPDETVLNRLGRALSESSLELSTELRPAYASLMLTVQLVNCLAYIMDCRLPCPIPLKEVSLKDRWTPEFLDDKWHKLCHCILFLGLRMGMDYKQLNFNCPHSNLIEMGQHILKGKITENLQPLGINGNYCETANGIIQKAERDLADWDIIEKDMM